jgi:3'-5' exoribonuclease
MIEQAKLNELKVGDKITHFLLMTSFSVKSTKTGNQFLDLQLQDQSASYNAKMWGNFESFLPEAKEGIVVKILATLEEFNNQPQIKIERIRVAAKEDQVSPSDFLPRSKRDFDEMKKELFEVIKSITEPHLNMLLLKILDKDNLDKYLKVPAGKAWHHAYIGGLIEHTLEIIKICQLMCDIHAELNRDLILTGAILHDLGKIEELEFNSGFEYSDKGKLLGHIVIVANMIEKETNEIEGFPADLKNQLIHLVLSHQGKLEYASPVVPKTLEAIVLYHADELSAKANAYKGAVLNEIDKKWTRYLPLAETAVYIPDSFPKEDDFKDTLF